MLLEIFVEYYRVKGCEVGTSGLDQGNGFLSCADLDKRCTGILQDIKVSSCGSVGNFFAIQGSHVYDILIVFGNYDLLGDVEIWSCKIVFLFTFLGNAYCIDNSVKTSAVDSGKKRIPVRFCEISFYTKLVCDCLCYFYVKSGKLSVIIMIGIWRIGSFHTDFQFSGFLNLGKFIISCVSHAACCQNSC